MHFNIFLEKKTTCFNEIRLYLIHLCINRMIVQDTFRLKRSCPIIELLLTVLDFEHNSDA